MGPKVHQEPCPTWWAPKDSALLLLWKHVGLALDLVDLVIAFQESWKSGFCCEISPLVKIQGKSICCLW